MSAVRSEIAPYLEIWAKWEFPRGRAGSPSTPLASISHPVDKIIFPALEGRNFLRPHSGARRAPATQLRHSLQWSPPGAGAAVC